MSDYSDQMKLIGYLYQIAIDPLCFEDLLAEWDKTIRQSIEDGSGGLANSALTDHAIRASDILGRIQTPADGPTPLPLAESIEFDPNPAILLSRKGMIISANSVARKQLDTSSGKDLASLFRSGGAAGKLGQVRDKLGSDAPAGEGILGLLEIEAPDDAEPALFALSRVVCSTDPDVAGLLTVLAPVWSTQTINAMQDHFELTRAEVEIVTELAGGKNVTEIAETRKTSVHTVRSQIKSILIKTNLDSQLDLIRHMGFLQRYEAKPETQFSSQVKVASADSESRTFMLELTSGRRMEYTLVGPAGGRPVLYIHGVIDGVNFTRETMRHLKRRNIMLIAPSRPGFGKSDPYRMPVNATSEFAANAVELLDALQIERFPAFGHMGGALYAVALAGIVPERVVSILSAAGAVPMIHGWQFSGMSAGHRIAGLTAKHAPAVLPLLIRGGIRLLRGDREDRMLALYFKDASADGKLARDPEIRKLLLDRYRFVIAQGQQAFETDVVHMSRDWSELIKYLKCPVMIVHGEHDKVVLTDGVRLFSKQIPNCELIVSPRSGQLVWSHEPALVLDQLERLLEPEHDLANGAEARD